MSNDKYCNPLIEVYKGVPIYKYNQIQIRVDSETKKQMIDLVESTGLSSKEILGYSSKPCVHCKGIYVTAHNSKDKGATIPRGILFEDWKKKYGEYNTKSKNK